MLKRPLNGKRRKERRSSSRKGNGRSEVHRRTLRTVSKKERKRRKRNIKRTKLISEPRDRVREAIVRRRKISQNDGFHQRRICGRVCPSHRSSSTFYRREESYQPGRPDNKFAIWYLNSKSSYCRERRVQERRRKSRSSSLRQASPERRISHAPSLVG